jgi:hypothetical protein
MNIAYELGDSNTKSKLTFPSAIMLTDENSHLFHRCYHKEAVLCGFINISKKYEGMPSVIEMKV